MSPAPDFDRRWELGSYDIRWREILQKGKEQPRTESAFAPPSTPWSLREKWVEASQRTHGRQDTTRYRMRSGPRKHAIFRGSVAARRRFEAGAVSSGPGEPAEP